MLNFVIDIIDIALSDDSLALLTGRIFTDTAMVSYGSDNKTYLDTYYMYHN